MNSIFFAIAQISADNGSTLLKLLIVFSNINQVSRGGGIYFISGGLNYEKVYRDFGQMWKKLI